jgi:hypothetical protein
MAVNLTACAYCDYLECRCDGLDDLRDDSRSEPETTEEDS